MDVFVFPSMTDTQGWVIHEAAIAGLPIVLIDQGVSEVVDAGVNGEYVDNTPESMADVLIDLLGDEAKRTAYGHESAMRARSFTEESQVAKLAALYETIIAKRDD
jgi:glycosyltransferase involved in cell wall biosynthesis